MAIFAQSVLRQRNTIVLFGGQGSSSLFSCSAVAAAENNCKTSLSASILALRCHTAFLEEYGSLHAQERQVLGIDIQQFQNLGSLLNPGPEYHRNGLVQSTTICLYQLIQYVAELERSSQDNGHLANQIFETTGFCSGLISAAVVASSQNSADIIRMGTEAFRLAFWVACRTVIEGQAQIGTRSHHGMWSIVVRGLNRSQIEKYLDQFSQQKQLHSLRVSAVTSLTAISLSGRPSEIAAFRDFLGSAAVITNLHIDAWYHGGEQLEGVVSQIIRDIEIRHIDFPSFTDLKTTLRSTSGIATPAKYPEANSLAEWIIRQILVCTVDWIKISHGVLSSMQETLKSNSTLQFKVLSFGPSSESLFTEFISSNLSTNVETIERSPFKVNRFHTSSTNPNDIAIVGMGVNFPMGKGQEELWATLSKGLSVVSEIPASRFDITQFSKSDGDDQSRTMPTKHGAFLDDIWGFDNTFFNISPREAKSMDPQQRILLMTTQRALEDAGYVGDATPSFQKKTVGCYIGLATGDYTDNLRDNIDVFYSPGTLRAFHSGRISYVNKLSGPSITTDTACSSSLVSMYHACRALQTGDCTAAIVGGVNTMSSPDMYLGLSRGHFLNESGGCKPFDSNADGYCRAEGCGIFILKRLSDALAENDRIHGIIKGVEVNQSGESHSITHPHSETQADLFHRVLARSQLDASSVSVVEAHGTGTQAGDKCEIESLEKVFGNRHSTTNPLIISSIKGNIGHSEAASGSAGLAKLILMLRKKVITVQAGLIDLNPQLPHVDRKGILIPRENRPWEQPLLGPRRALLNNFGAAGSNAALVLEEPRDLDPSIEAVDDRSASIFNLSAKSMHALEISLKEHRIFLSTVDKKTKLRDVCYTASARRQVHSYRLSIPTSSISDLQSKLEKIDITATKAARLAKARIFLFSGQGGTHYGMGAELMKTSPQFRRSISECDNIVQTLGLPSMLNILQNSANQSHSLETESMIAVSQCACVSVEYALAKLLISWNIKPDYAIGHSLGEYAALAVAGALTLEDALYIVASRAKLMIANCRLNQTGMLACSISSSAAEKLFDDHEKMSQLSVACKNSGNDCVVAGPLTVLSEFKKLCGNLGIKTKGLAVPYGFHSPAMDPIVGPLQDLGRSIRWSPPSFPVASNVHGRLFEIHDLQSDYFALHARQPVLFAETIQAFHAQKIFNNAVCVEIGPHPITLPLLRKSLPEGICSFVPTLQKDRESWTTIFAALSQISLVADDIDWREVFSGSGARMTDIPGHPLQLTPFAIPYQEQSHCITSLRPRSEPHTETGQCLLPKLLVSRSSDSNLVFETSTELLGPLITGHNVGGVCICPASLFHELILEAAQVSLIPSTSTVLTVYNMSFPTPLIYEPAEGARPVHISIRRVNNVLKSADIAEVEVTIKTLGKETKETLCCSAVALVKTTKELEYQFVKDTTIVSRQTRHLVNSNSLHSTFRTKLLYETIFNRVVSYSVEYQALTSLSVSDSDLEGTGTFQLPAKSRAIGCIANPVFIDTLLHAAGFVANLTVPSEEICICGQVESVEILYDRIDYSETFTVYYSLIDSVKGTIFADAFAVNSAGKVIAAVRGMVFKRLRLSSFQRMLNHSSVESRPEAALIQNEQTSTKESTTPAAPPAQATRVDASAMSPDRQEIRLRFRNIIGEVYGAAEALDPNQSLAQLGIDSMMQIEITAKLNQAFPRSALDHDLLFNCDTLRESEEKLLSMFDPPQPGQTDSKATTIQTPNESTPTTRSSPSQEESLGNNDLGDFGDQYPQIHLEQPTPTKPTVLHASSGLQTPLCLIHDGSGQSSMYRQIRSPDRSILAFHDPDFLSPARQTTSIEQMARRYVASLSPLETPSLIIGGWSFGGVVAYEAARQLLDDGFPVRGLLLIDSPLPRNHEPLPENVITYVLGSRTNNNNNNNNNATTPPNPHLLSSFTHCARLLAQYNPPPLPPTQQSRLKTVMLRSAETFDASALCGVEYGWLERQDVRDEAIRGWRKLVGQGMQVLEIQGNHFEVFERDAVEVNSAQIIQACKMIDDGAVTAA